MKKGTTRARGIRTPIPKGHLWGRSDLAAGDAHPIKVGARLTIANGTISADDQTGNDAAIATGMGFNDTGTYSSNVEVLGRGVFSYPVTFPSAHHTDIVIADVGPISSAALTWRVEGVGTVGTITFAAHATLAVTAWVGGSYTLPANTPIELVSPDPPDPILFNVTGTVYGDAA